MQPQQTGFQPQQQFNQPPQQQQQAPAALVPQKTGFGGVGSQFLSTFMPSQAIQPSTFMQPSQMQFQTQGGQLQHSFEQVNQMSQGQATVKIPWALTADEKKRYDQIFRAWDQQGNGFIAGQVAKEVFGQAGLDRDDLMAIW